MLKIMNFILFVFLLLGCDNGVPDPDRAVPLTSKLMRLALFEGSVIKNTYELGYSTQDGRIISLSTTTAGISTKYTVLGDTSRYIRALVLGKDTLKYQYNSNKELIAVQSSSVETYEYSAGLLRYYARTRKVSGSPINEEIDINTYKAGQLSTQSRSIPGKSVEQEAYTISKDPNPLYLLLKALGPVIRIREGYAISPLMPSKSIKAFEGSNLRYSVERDAQKRLTAFIIQKETATGPIDFQKYVLSYYP
jgi:hypothetical protein